MRNSITSPDIGSLSTGPSTAGGSTSMGDTSYANLLLEFIRSDGRPSHIQGFNIWLRLFFHGQRFCAILSLSIDIADLHTVQHTNRNIRLNNNNHYVFLDINIRAISGSNTDTEQNGYHIDS
jgi:hypothetical protein